MGIACPQCGTQTDVDFGMAQCSNCQAVFYVNIDGSTNQSDDKVSEAIAPEENFSEMPIESESSPENSNLENDNQSWSGGWEENSVEEPVSSDSGNSWGVSSSVEENSEVNQWESEEVIKPDEVNQASNNNEIPEDVVPIDSVEQEDFESIDSENATWSSDSIQTGDMSASDMINDVVEFGNSEDSGAREGIISYNLLIKGIDTSVERALIHEVLEDRKLMLSPEELMLEIDNGELLIEKLNPVKTAVIVAGLHNSGLKVLWSQHALNE